IAAPRRPEMPAHPPSRRRSPAGSRTVARPVPRERAGPGRAAAPVFLRSRLARPNVSPLLLDRPRLVQTLVERADGPLTLVVADAGYGKTTLLAAASRQLRRPVVWYSLLASDADPVVFGRHLLTAFRIQQPRFGADLERMLDEARPGPRTGEILGGMLANAVATLKGPPHLLVL